MTQDISAPDKVENSTTTTNTHYYVVVTGANRGFGQAIVEAFADHVHAYEETLEILLVGRNLNELELVGQDLTYTSENGNSWIKARSLGGINFSNLNTISGLNFQPRFTPSGKDVVSILINNAGSLPDLSKTLNEQSSIQNIHILSNYIDSNLTSFLVLSSQFRTSSYSKEDYQLASNSWLSVIVNISSLLAIQPAKNWGLYAIVKSARDMAMKIMSLEENNESVKTLSYAPGPLNNTMQKEVRDTLGDDDQRQLYTKMHEDGKLVSMEESAAKLIRLITRNNFVSGSHIDFYDEELNQ